MSLQNSSEIISVNDLTESSVGRSATIKQKLLNGDYSFNSKRGRSKVWDTFSKINDNNGMEMADYVACKTCYNIYKFTGSTSNLVKHKCYTRTPKQVAEVNVDTTTKQEGITLVTEWTLKNCRSFKIINDSGFKKFAKYLIEVGAKFGPDVNVENLLPHPTTVSRNISALYELHVGPVKEEIIKYKCFGYSLTSDIWTDNFLRSSYLSCTVHYIKEGVLINRLLAIKSMEGESCTGSKIKEKMAQILRQFGCDLEEDKPVIVTDRGSNMIAAFRDGQNIHCVNHLLHNAVEKAIKRVPELTEIVSKCSKLVKFFKKSGANCKLGVSLKSHCPTRWNTIYYLLKSVEENWVDITNILIEKNEINRLEGINITYLSSIVSLLAAFEEASKKLESAKSPTIHLTIPYIHKLQKKCISDPNDNIIITQLKSVLDELLKSTVLQNLTKYHNIALFLFPPTNKLLNFSQLDKLNTIKDCKDIMEMCLDQLGDETNETAIDDDNVFADFIATTNDDTIMHKIDKEIESYANVNVVLTDEFDCIQWWKMHKKHFPILFKTSCKILSIPASSAASERAFSDARNLISEKRCIVATNPDNVNKIMFLHSNI